MDGDADHQVLAKLPVLSGAVSGLLKGSDRAAFQGGRAAPDGTLDVVLHHEVEPTCRGADHWLPALHWKMDRPRHQREVLQRIAAIRHFRGQRVVLALVREAVAV